jgi:DNA primase
MKFSRDVVQKIRDRIDMVEIVNGYTHLEQRGDRWWGLSPFKNEKTPSFTVKPDEGFYYCFATQKGGDIFRFVGEMEGLSFPETVSLLAERAGIAIESTPADEHADRERRSLYELYERVTKTFRYLLEEDPRGEVARNYEAERNIDTATGATFELGYSPDDGRWLYRFLRSKSYSDEFLANCGLFSKRSPQYSLFRNRLMFPIRDERERVVAFGGRALSSEERAKYINSPETPIYFKKRTLYGLSVALDEMRRTRSVYIAEGYMDVIALHQGGVTNVVAPLGTAFTDEQAKLLSRWIDTVTFVFDADTAGVDATFRGALVAEKAGLAGSAVALGGDKDPSDLFAKGGREAIQALVEDRRPVFEYLLDAAVAITPPKDERNRELLLRKLFPYINIVSSEVRREGLLSQLSDTVFVSPTAVQRDFERWRTGEQPRRVEDQTTTHETIKTSRDLKLMLATAHDGELFAYLRQRVSAEDVEDEIARGLYYRMEDAYRHGERLPRGLVDRLEEEKLRNFVLERITSEEFRGWTREDIDRAIRFTRIRSLEEQQRGVERQLRRVDGNDIQEIRRIQERKMAIDQELAKLKVRADD